MGHESLSKLLQRWEAHAAKASQLETVPLALMATDKVRLQALAQVYQLSEAEVTASLLHEALNELEARMPYIPGKEVIRVEDGEEIFADEGPMPRYLAAQAALNKKPPS